MDPNKRKFPYYSEVQSFNVKRQGLDSGDVNPGQAHADTRIFQQPNLFDNYGELRVNPLQKQQMRIGLV